MSTITKERLQRLIRAIESESYDEEEIVGWVNSGEIMELARIALASLEAEPVPGLFIKCTNIEPRPGEVTIAQATPMADGKYHESCFQLYAAPPALVANIHPLLEFAREYIESWDLGMAGDSSLLASAKKAIADSSAHQPAPVSVPDLTALNNLAGEMLNHAMNCERRVAVAYTHCAHRLAEEVRDLRAAMLQGAEHDFREISNSSTNNFRENAETSTKCWCRTCRPITLTDMRFVVCPECGNKRCPHANDHRHACTGSNEPGQEGSAYPAAPQQEVK